MQRIEHVPSGALSEEFGRANFVEPAGFFFLNAEVRFGPNHSSSFLPRIRLRFGLKEMDHPDFTRAAWFKLRMQSRWSMIHSDLWRQWKLPDPRELTQEPSLWIKGTKLLSVKLCLSIPDLGVPVDDVAFYIGDLSDSPGACFLGLDFLNRHRMLITERYTYLLK